MVERRGIGVYSGRGRTRGSVGHTLCESTRLWDSSGRPHRRLAVVMGLEGGVTMIGVSLEGYLLSNGKYGGHISL